MTAIVCIDDRGGTLFNKRRQSRDRVLTEDVVSIAEKEGARLLASPFSEKLLSEHSSNVIYCEDFLDVAEGNDVCFVEDRPLLPYFDKIDKLIIYHWNRTYPYDTCLDLLPLSKIWKLDGSFELAGYSHEKITKEIYLK